MMWGKLEKVTSRWCTPAHLCERFICCEYCSIVLRSTVILRDHLSEANHPHTKIYRRGTCTLGYPSALLLMIHQSSGVDQLKLTIHQKVRLKCGQCPVTCPATFSAKSALRQHISEYQLVFYVGWDLNILVTNRTVWNLKLRCATPIQGYWEKLFRIKIYSLCSFLFLQHFHAQFVIRNILTEAI